ncbi:hypothetical protein IJT17_07930 [bacterium]|nr:hypothetical protein [bacterium]
MALYKRGNLPGQEVHALKQTRHKRLRIPFRYSSAITQQRHNAIDPRFRIDKHMEEQKCPYCGKSAVPETDYLYKCTECGIISAASDIGPKDKSSGAQPAPPAYSPLQSIGGFADDGEEILAVRTDMAEQSSESGSKNEEEKDLQTAWRLMSRHSADWTRALELLNKHGYPIQHPAEFIVFRGICQTAPLLKCDFQDLEERYQAMDIFIANLQKLEHYLPKGDDEASSQTIKAIYEALKMYGELQISYHFVYYMKDMWKLHKVRSQHSAKNGKNDSKPDMRDHTGEKRTALLGTFAEQLEELQDTSHGTEYLKMACRLWHSCLRHARGETGYYIDFRYKPLFDAFPYEEFFITKDLFDQIATKVRQLNEIIKQRDPAFQPEDPPSFRTANDNGRTVVMAAYTIVVLLIFYFVFSMKT